METTQTIHTQDIDTLNSFLRGEISSVETYRQALDKITDVQTRTTLTECLSSHEQRVLSLSGYIQRLGGTPARTSGVWGAFAKLTEGGAKLFGEKAAIAALEEGEDHGRNDYRRDLPKLEPATRRFIESEVLPEQETTHRRLSVLKKTQH